MRILALDTTTQRGSVALVIDGQVTRCVASDGDQPPASRLPTELMAAMEQAGYGLDALDAFAVATGPGSFTGLRIGIATMQGLALALDRPLVGVSALDALAATVEDEAAGWDVAAWIDAWRGEVYAASYRAGTVVDVARVGPPGDILATLAGRRVLFVGNGVAAHGETIETASAVDGRVAADLTPLLAPTVARLAMRALNAGGRLRPHAVRPTYVRRPDAELARTARARG